MKVLVVKQNGYKWHIPAKKIAENYATYYSDNHDNDYDLEYNFCMADYYTMSDWFASNMDLDDIAEHAILVERPTPQDTINLREEYDYDFEDV